MKKLIFLYRGWFIEVTATATATKDDQRFELTDYEPALRAAKAEVDEREGPEVWIEGYTNQYLQENKNDRPD